MPGIILVYVHMSSQTGQKWVNMDGQYEVYREVFSITEWKDDAIYTTVSLGYGWYDMDMVDANQPKQTNLIYAPPSTTNHDVAMPIRRKR